MRVLCILVETTVPVRIRPRMETVPVKGHFLSANPSLLALLFSRLYSASHARIDLFNLLSVSSVAIPQNTPRHTDIGALDGSLGGSEAQANILVPSSAAVTRLGGLRLRLRVEEDVRLLLESPLGLNREFCRHVCVLDQRFDRGKPASEFGGSGVLSAWRDREIERELCRLQVLGERSHFCRLGLRAHKNLASG
jgi:hypothetical protein